MARTSRAGRVQQQIVAIASRLLCFLWPIVLVVSAVQASDGRAPVFGKAEEHPSVSTLARGLIHEVLPQAMLRYIHQQEKASWAAVDKPLPSWTENGAMTYRSDITDAARGNLAGPISHRAQQHFAAHGLAVPQTKNYARDGINRVDYWLSQIIVARRLDDPSVPTLVGTHVSHDLFHMFFLPEFADYRQIMLLGTLAEVLESSLGDKDDVLDLDKVRLWFASGMDVRFSHEGESMQPLTNGASTYFRMVGGSLHACLEATLEQIATEHIEQKAETSKTVVFPHSYIYSAGHEWEPWKMSELGDMAGRVAQRRSADLAQITRSPSSILPQDSLSLLKSDVIEAIWEMTPAAAASIYIVGVR